MADPTPDDTDTASAAPVQPPRPVAPVPAEADAKLAKTVQAQAHNLTELTETVANLRLQVEGLELWKERVSKKLNSMGGSRV